jgi:hypothetical protein
MDARTTGEGYLHNLAERVLKREEIQVVSVQSRTLSLLRDDTVDAMHVSFQWILTMIVLSLVLIPAIHYIYTLSGIAEIAVFVITAILQIIALRKCRKFVYHVSVRRPDFKHTELEFNRKK